LRSVVPTAEQPGSPRYEIFHDVLGAAVLDWRRRFLADKAKTEARKQAEAQLEAARRESEQERQLSEERARRAEERLQGARKVRRLANIIFATIVIAVVASGFAWSNLVQRRHAEQEQALAKTGRQEAEKSLELEHKKETEAIAAAEAANKAAQRSKGQNDLAQKANLALVTQLQAQLDEARKIIQTSTNESGANAALARTYLETAKQAQAELDKTRAEAKELAAKAAEALRRAELAQQEADRAKSEAAAAHEGVVQNNKWEGILNGQRINAGPTSKSK
jgi:hypothetical protein